MPIPDEDAILEAARAEGRKKLRAGIYTRMSLAIMGDKTKVDDQERICRELAERRGDMDVADVYCDNNASAWQPNRKRRGWDRMLADIEAGRIDAIVTYHGDRLVRRHEDLSLLLRLAKSKGIRLASPTGTRNLDSDDDQFILEIECSMAKRESANISRRRKDQYKRWRREGRTRPGGQGGRAFGFASDGVTHLPADRCIVATRREVTEAGIIREMAMRILAGETPGPIAKDMTARGWRTPSGNKLTHNSVIYILSRPRTAGLMPDGENKATWEPVLDRETWERVRLVLEARADGYDRATNARRWLLSGIAVCGAPDGDSVCEEPLQSHTARRNKARGLKAAPVYWCPREGCRKIQRSAPLLDAYVSRMTVNRLNDPRNPEGRPVAADTAAEWTALSREREETEALLADYRTSAGRARPLMNRLDAIDDRLEQLRERETGQSRSRMLDTYRGISAEAFDGLPLAVRRSLVAACFRVTVLPASRRGPGFNTDDVRLEPL